jgi:hypothetical protein
MTVSGRNRLQQRVNTVVDLSFKKIEQRIKDRKKLHRQFVEKVKTY